jgi:RHS repeat-associated protein
LRELALYGSGRIGLAQIKGNSTNYVYELADHLGNVRATVQKNSNSLALTSQADYYPFGMIMPNKAKTPNEYRFGYQGQFAEKDEETGYNQFEARLWDNRIGRWLTVDPKKQFHSPYLGMGNNPIIGIDPDGRDVFVLLASNGAMKFGHLAVLIGDDNVGWQFISKEGRRDQEGDSFLAPLIGGPALEPATSPFSTLDEFMVSDLVGDGTKYDKGYLIKSSKNSEMEKAALKSAKSYYNFLLNNCADAASAALKAGGLDPGYFRDQFRRPHLSMIPKERFMQIMINNSGGIFYDLLKEKMNLNKKPSVEAGPLKINSIIDE